MDNQLRTDVGSIRESRLHPRVREGRGHLSPHEVDVDGHDHVHQHRREGAALQQSSLLGLHPLAGWRRTRGLCEAKLDAALGSKQSVAWARARQQPLRLTHVYVAIM